MTSRFRVFEVWRCAACGNDHQLTCVPWHEGGWIGVCCGVAVFVRETGAEGEHANAG